jgi:hypothetical protein
MNELEEHGSYLNGGSGRVWDSLASEDLACEEGGKAGSIEASTHDELVSVNVVAGDATSESVLRAAEVLIGNVVVLGSSGEVIVKSVLDSLFVIVTQAVEVSVLLTDEDVSKSKQVLRESVDVVDTNLTQGCHVIIVSSCSGKLRASTETKLCLGNTENGSKLLHLNLLFNII